VDGDPSLVNGSADGRYFRREKLPEDWTCILRDSDITESRPRAGHACLMQVHTTFINTFFIFMYETLYLNASKSCLIPLDNAADSR
jgi:hypothetical protein